MMGPRVYQKGARTQLCIREGYVALKSARRRHAHTLHKELNEDTELAVSSTESFVVNLDFNCTQSQVTAEELLSIVQRCENGLEGSLLHSLVILDGHHQDRLLCNFIVRMYGKSGSVEDAVASFALIGHPNVFSWCMLIGMYAQQGCVGNATDAFNQMLCEGIFADKAVFVAILSAFCSPNAVAEGRHIHVRVIACECLPDVVVGTALLSMYSNCSHVDDAWSVFVTMPTRNTISWNAILASFNEYGSDINMQILAQMMTEGAFPDEVTFVNILVAYAKTGDLFNAKQVHALCVHQELISDILIGTALINVYRKYDELELSEKVFQTMEGKDAVSFALMIVTYTQSGQYGESVQLFFRMFMEGFLPNLTAVTSYLESCTDVCQGRRIHVLIISCESATDTDVNIALFKMYAKFDKFNLVCKIFDQMLQPNVVSWTELMNACLQKERFKDAQKHYMQMLAESVIPDSIAMMAMLDASSSEESILIGKYIHSCVCGVKHEIEAPLHNALINFYGEYGCLIDAKRTLLEMPHRDVIGWSSLIKAFAENTEFEEAFYFFEQMEHQGIKADKVCLITLLDVCACYAALPEGKYIHYRIVDMGLKPDLVIVTALMTMYGNCGCLEDARWVFDRSVTRNTVTWNAIIDAYGQHGFAKESLEMFHKMQAEGFKPDQVTFQNVLSAFRHGGFVDDGCNLFVSMCEDHNVSPSVDHFNSMIDLMARAGLLDESERLITSMPCHPNGSSWMTLLGACKKHLDVKRGIDAAAHVFKLDSDSISPYVLLSNIYIAVDRWNTDEENHEMLFYL